MNRTTLPDRGMLFPLPPQGPVVDENVRIPDGLSTENGQVKIEASVSLHALPTLWTCSAVDQITARWTGSKTWIEGRQPTEDRVFECEKKRRKHQKTR